MNRKLAYLLFLLIIMACVMREITVDMPRPKGQGIIGMIYKLAFYGKGDIYHIINYIVIISTLICIGLMRSSRKWQMEQPEMSNIKIIHAENGLDAFRKVFPDLKLKGENPSVE